MGQIPRPPYLPGPAQAPATTLATPRTLKPIRPDAPPAGTFRVYAVDQAKEGSQYHLRGRAEVETPEMILKADEIDYDRDTGDAEARGHVYFEHFTNGEKLSASRAEYNTDEQTGKFWDVSGTSPAKIEARPGVLTTTNPFYFEGKWAERQQDKYILHDGLITDCQMPNAWWVLKAPTFDVIPNNRAIAYRSVFWFKNRIPLFYAPALYKSLRKNPRKSGFLTPNIGNSSRRGKMFGVGYYWAINRSYDLAYRNQYFTQRGFAHHVDFRGKVNQRTDFDATVYGVNDRGIKIGDEIRKQGGFLASLNARSDLGKGWLARADINYLSSFEFRQNFTESFNEAIFAESHSIAYLTRHWSSFGVNLAFDRAEVFQISSNNEDRLIVRKMPELQFIVRERPIWKKVPLWVSLDSSAGLLHREQPLFQTREFVDRIDFAPRIMTAAFWKGFSLVPSISGRVTHYGSSFAAGTAIGSNLVRTSREFNLDMALPSLARIYKAPAWLGGVEKIKHVVEGRALFRDIAGVDDFRQIIRFDELETYANTRELEVSLTNRFYTRSRDGNVNEALTWQVFQRRYFDPTFGGAVVPGQRNVVLSSADLTGFSFIDRPRSYSPIVSSLRYSYKVGLEWRSDYDPLRQHIVNSGLTADYRAEKYYVSFGHYQVRNDPVIAPSSNQFRGGFGIGKENRRGWNAGSMLSYDYKKQLVQYATTQVTYNTDCCGFSVQYRRFNVGTRNDYNVLFAFAVSNIGTFGTLKRQERVF